MVSKGLCFGPDSPPELKPLVGSKLSIANAFALSAIPKENDQIVLANKLMAVKEYLHMGGGGYNKQRVALDCRCPTCGYIHPSIKKK